MSIHKAIHSCYSIFLLIVSSVCVWAQQPTAATTEDGRKILVYPDGTWLPDKPTAVEVPRSATPRSTASTAKAAENDPAIKWAYSESEDKMGSGTTKFASIRSVNEFSFGFPYSGNQHAVLTLRVGPKKAGRQADSNKDVVLQIEQGQFLSGHGSDDRVKARFDNARPQGFFFKGPADQRTATIFLSDYAHFLRELRKAKKISIEATFYREGKRVFEFDVSGLKWSDFAPEGPDLLPATVYDNLGAQ